MLVQSHKVMADIIFDQIEEKTEFSLSRRYFKLGNMSPDLPFYHSHLKHYKAQNYGFILDMIEELTTIDPFKNIGSLNKYSYRLGVICHYVCDYFCLPHHDRAAFEDRLMEHLSYERALHKELKKYHPDNLIKHTSLDLYQNHNFMELIDDFHNEYISKELSYKNDVKYGIFAGSIICSVIIITTVKKIYLP